MIFLTKLFYITFIFLKIFSEKKIKTKMKDKLKTFFKNIFQLKKMIYITSIKKYIQKYWGIFAQKIGKCKMLFMTQIL